MDGVIHFLAQRTQTAISHAASFVKEQISSLTGNTSVSIQQLAEVIQQHQETKRTEKELLGRTYSFWSLNKGDVHFYLEKNGSNILELNVIAKNETIFTYRSYRDKASLNTLIKFPESLMPE